MVTLLPAGIYSTPVFDAPGLRVLNVNTNPWIRRKGGAGWPAQEGDDPAQMFEYMQVELAKARRSKEKVILQGEIKQMACNPFSETTQGAIVLLLLTTHLHTQTCLCLASKGTFRQATPHALLPRAQPGVKMQTSTSSRSWQIFRMLSSASSTDMNTATLSGSTVM